MKNKNRGKRYRKSEEGRENEIERKSVRKKDREEERGRE